MSEAGSSEQSGFSAGLGAEQQASHDVGISSYDTTTVANSIGSIANGAECYSMGFEGDSPFGTPDDRAGDEAEVSAVNAMDPALADVLLPNGLQEMRVTRCALWISPLVCGLSEFLATPACDNDSPVFPKRLPDETR